MKQLLIVNSAAALNGGAAKPSDLSGMAVGAIGFFELDDFSKWLGAKPTKNFGIALGRGTDKSAFVIPEIDLDTLTVTEASPATGVAYKGEITIPTPTAGQDYTLILVKNGVSFHERNTWTSTYKLPIGKTMEASALAKVLGDVFKNMSEAGSLDVNVEVSAAKITITGKNKGEQWTLKAGDALYGTTVTETPAEPPVGDNSYIANLASQCAAGKGFNYTDLEGRDLYPGYPEKVEDVAYTLFTLRFAVGRDASHQVDERVWQIVHIAVPSTSAALAKIKTILGTATGE